MKVPIFIPSSGRADRQMTWAALPNRWRKRTAIFVNHTDGPEYFKHVFYTVHSHGIVGLGRIRQHIIDTTNSKYIFMMDDDVQFYVRRDRKLARATPTEVGNALDMLLDWLKKEKDVAQVGLSLSMLNIRKNSLYEYNEKCTVVTGINVELFRDLGIRYDAMPNGLLEDLHANLCVLEKGYKLKVSYQYAFQNMPPKGATGLSSYRTQATELAACELLQSLHPDYVKLINKKPRNTKYTLYNRTVIPRISWKKAYGDAVKKQVASLTVRFMKKNESRKKFPKGHAKHPLTREFLGVWTKFQNFEEHPPIIVLDGRKVVAFHAATFNKKTYVNSYYQYVDETYRGKGIGGLMFDFLLKEAYKRKLERWKTTCKIDSDGDRFYKGFGLMPAFRDDKFNYYDVGINKVKHIGDLHRKHTTSVPQNVISKHLDRNQCLLA